MLLVILMCFCVGAGVYLLSFGHIKKRILADYGKKVVSVEYDISQDLFKLIVGLPLHSDLASETRRQLEADYPGKLKYKLVDSGSDQVYIVTEEDQNRYRQGLMLRYTLYEGCRLVETPDIESAKKNVTYLSDSSVQELMHSMLEKYPEIVPQDKTLVEENDLVKISYCIFSETREYMKVEMETVKCGFVNFDNQIEESVRGKTVGESYTIPYNNPDISEDTLYCRIEPLFIYYTKPAELNNEFVRAHTPYQSVSEWENALVAEDEQAFKEEQWKLLVWNLASESGFEIDEDIIAQQAADLYLSSTLIAKEFGLDVQDYMLQKYSNESSEDFLLRLYRICEEQIKEYLLVQAIAAYAGIEIQDAEIKDVCERNGTVWEELDVENHALILLSLLKNKVVDYMMEITAQ